MAKTNTKAKTTEVETAKILSSATVSVAPVDVPVVQKAKKVAKVAKTEDVAVSATSTPAPVTATAPVTPKATKASKTSASASVATPVVVAPVVSTTAVVTETVEEAVSDVVDGDASLLEKSAEFCTKLQQLGALITTLKSEYKVLEKQWSRELKSANKLSVKRKRKSGNRAPSGFVKPTRISDELATFLEKPIGSEMARTEVTRDINKYIRTNALQDKENGRHINPDDKLSALLKINKGEELTYFNLQRYMSPHFSKAVKTTTSV